MHIWGIGFALLALVCWGFGDFLIQRTSRDFGIWPSLFCITGLGAIVLFPFAIRSFPAIYANLPFLLLLGAITTLVAILEFKALKMGKISIIEPIMSFELPLTVLLGVIILNEFLSPLQMILIAIIFGGILLLGYTGSFRSKHLLEKGALLALGATLVMATVNLTTGLASQKIGPVATIWMVHTFIALVCIIRFFLTRTWKHLFHDVRKHPVESFLVAICDNSAWLAYSAAVLYIPISLTITLTESYIVLAIVLGVIINKEKLMRHQWAGVLITIAAVLFLSHISS